MPTVLIHEKNKHISRVIYPLRHIAKAFFHFIHIRHHTRPKGISAYCDHKYYPLYTIDAYNKRTLFPMNVIPKYLFRMLAEKNPFIIFCHVFIDFDRLNHFDDMDECI